jgi:hypothetical protein
VIEIQIKFRQFPSNFMGISFKFQATANVLSSIQQPIKAFPNQICFSFAIHRAVKANIGLVMPSRVLLSESEREASAGVSTTYFLVAILLADLDLQILQNSRFCRKSDRKLRSRKLTPTIVKYLWK